MTYIGDELETFAEAVNWRRYWMAQIRPFVLQRVLEVGAGLGTVTLALSGPRIDDWVALEPDPTMAAKLRDDRLSGALPAPCRPREGTVADLAQGEQFDTALYIDVLEHIADDRAEVEAVVRHLRPGAHLIVLAPAHQGLYSEFDRAIGHFRRYGREQLLGLTVAGTVPVFARYLDAAGLLASLGNRLLLRQSNPSRAQILFWDRRLVAASRLIDPLLRYRYGKSVVVVWRKL